MKRIKTNRNGKEGLLKLIGEGFLTGTFTLDVREIESPEEYILGIRNYLIDRGYEAVVSPIRGGEEFYTIAFKKMGDS